MNYVRLSSLFSGPFLRKVASGNYQRVYSEVISSYGFKSLLQLSLGEALDALYSILVKHYRCEYIYKNAFLQRRILSRYSFKRSYFIDEFVVGNSRADLAVFSNQSICFEIKTDYDSTQRLDSQWKNYSEVFDKIYVVTSPRLYDRLKTILPESVGIIVFNDNNTFSTMRAALSNFRRIRSSALFQCLRQDEYQSSINEYYGCLPSVNPLEMRDECERLFSKIAPRDAHDLFLKRLRCRKFNRKLESVIDSVPSCLTMAVLEMRSPISDLIKIPTELCERVNCDGTVFPLFERQAL